MKKIVVIPVASSLHGTEYYVSTFESFRRYLDRYGGIEILRIVTDQDNVEAIAKEYIDYIPIFVSLTGGTSRLIRRFASSAGYSRAILFGHGGHNSWASAISAKIKLELDGLWTWIYGCKDINDPVCSSVVDEMMRVSIATASVLKSRIGVVGFSEKTDIMEDFEARFESTVIPIPTDKLCEYASNVRDEEVEAFVKRVEEVFDLARVSREAIRKIGRIYYALKKLFEDYNLDAIAIDCFPYLVQNKICPCLALAMLQSEGYVVACEADLSMTLLMLVSKSLIGSVGWIANASAFEGSKIYLAHCTAPLNYLTKPMLIDHMESTYPYAVTGEIIGDTFTIVSLSPDFTTLVVACGKAVGKGLIYYSMCRTQLVLDLDLDAEKIPLVAPANHHLVIPGDVRQELKAVATLLGLDYSEYRELLAMV